MHPVLKQVYTRKKKEENKSKLISGRDAILVSSFRPIKETIRIPFFYLR